MENAFRSLYVVVENEKKNSVIFGLDCLEAYNIGVYVVCTHFIRMHAFRLKGLIWI